MNTTKTIAVNENEVIEFYINGRNQLCGSYYGIKTRGKNKGAKKVFQNYYFSTEARREEWANEIVNAANIRKARKKQEAETKAELLNNFVNPFQVGDLLYSSWGYEQTNIDFFKVVAVKNKTITIVPIGQNVVKGSEGFMSELVTPDADYICGGEIKKQIGVSINYAGVIDYRIKGDKYISRYTYGSEGVYQSHYA